MIYNQSDVAWKQILDFYFKDFVEFCLLDLYRLIDWNKPWESLDKELQAITKGEDSSKRLLDKLFKVFIKDGREHWVLVHCEIVRHASRAFKARKRNQLKRRLPGDICLQFQRKGVPDSVYIGSK